MQDAVARRLFAAYVRGIGVIVGAMNHRGRFVKPWRALPPTTRIAAAIVAAATLALPATGYGSSRSSTGVGATPHARGSIVSRSGNTPGLLAFSRCMRSHGVPNFPDPQPATNTAKFPTAQQLGVSDARYQAAEKHCQPLLPAGTDDRFPPAEVRLLLTGMLAFSKCMRSHGVANFPDPTTDSQGRPVFVFPQGEHRRLGSPPFLAPVRECRHLLPNQLGGIPLG